MLFSFLLVVPKLFVIDNLALTQAHIVYQSVLMPRKLPCSKKFLITRLQLLMFYY